MRNEGRKWLNGGGGEYDVKRSKGRYNIMLFTAAVLFGQSLSCVSFSSFPSPNVNDDVVAMS